MTDRKYPYPNDYRRDALAAQLQAAFGDRDAAWLQANPARVQVGGRVLFKQAATGAGASGRAGAAKIADRTGTIQLTLQPEALGDDYAIFEDADVGDIIGAGGVLWRNGSGELAVRVDNLRMIVKSSRRLPEKLPAVDASGTGTRYRQRHLDLILSETSRNVFRTRARIISYLRDFLDALDFLEVETPMLQPLPGGASARPFVTHHEALGRDVYVRVAPELYLKRLVVGGFERVYEISRNARNETLSAQSNSELTALEVYLAYADYRDLMDWIEKAVRGIADTLHGKQQIDYQGRRYDLGKAFRRLTLEQAIIATNPGIDPLSLRDVTYLRTVCERLGVEVSAHDGAGKLQQAIFDKTAAHTLLDPTFVHAYPAEVSPLARANDSDAFLTDRFGFFLAGRELANGYSELNDAQDQAARLRAQAALREKGDERAMFYDADFVQALEYGMPPTAGLEVGIDRVVMFFTDSASIRDVILFPHLPPGAG